VRRQGDWLSALGLEATLFCGGGWYFDERVAAAVAELGYADCTATAFRPSYLAPDAPHLQLGEPTWLELAGGRRVLELPTTHSIGMLTRGVLRLRLAGPVVHAYFHDTDLLDRRRRTALQLALCVLAARCRVTDLDRLRAAIGPDVRVPFGQVFQFGNPAHGANDA
jgi:hypothetical protein